MADPADPYKVLQVDSEAEDEVIQAAYRRLAQKYHPDVASGPDAAARMAAINAAWEVLRDPTRRAAHDLARRLAARNAERAAAEGGRPSAGAPSGGRGGHGPTTDTGGRGSTARGTAGPGADVSPRSPDTVSSDWTSGRSSVGGGYDPSSMGAPDGLGAAGPPPGNPAGPAGPMPGPVNYQDIGTNIDCNAKVVNEGFELRISVSDTSVYANIQDNATPTVGNMPVFRSYQSTNTLVLKDGQSREFTAATDRVSGEVIRIGVTMRVVK